MPSMHDLLQQAGPALHDYGLWVVFVNLLLETFGLPLPGETLLITASLLAAQGTFNGPLLFLTAWSASVLGDNLAFYAGRYGGRRFLLRFGAKVGIDRHKIRRMERFYARFGAQVVLFARFMVVARQLNGLVGGALGMRPLRFLIYNVLGGALWVGFWVAGTYYLGDHIRILLTWTSRFAVPMMILTTISGVLFLIYRLVRKRMTRSR